MKRWMISLLCLLLVCGVLLCGCGADNGDDITVITKGSVSHSLHTTTTTTTTAPTTTTQNQNGGATQSGQATPTTRPTIVADNGSTDIGNRIAETAISLIGTPFKNGASGPDAFDNPGFVSYCYKQVGLTVSRRASAMLTFGKEAALDALQPGDILIFCNEIGGEAQFVGIYIGGNQFVACNNPETPTKAQKIDNKYWLPRLLSARRAAE